MIPILKLKALENRIIKTFPNALNRMDYFRSLYTSVQDGNGALHAHDKKCNSRVAGRDINNSVQIAEWACSANGSTQQ